MLSLIFLGSILFILISIVFYSFKYGISPTPTSFKVRKVLLNELPGNFSGTILELGSGFGSLAFCLAKKYPKSQVLAFEISPIPYIFSLMLQLFQKQKNLHFFQKDFYNFNLKDGDLIICYLFPGAMNKLVKKFETELKKGSLVVSHTFALPGKKAERVVRVDDLYRTPIYFYSY